MRILRDEGGAARYSYTNTLPSRLKNYTLVVEDIGTKITATLYRKSRRIGACWAYCRHQPEGKYPRIGWEPHASILYSYQGRGLGKLLYRTLINHLKGLGYKLLVGYRHTAAAHRVHKSLRKEGLKFNCRKLAKSENISGFNCTYSKYRVRIDG